MSEDEAFFQFSSENEVQQIDQWANEGKITMN
jgi:hypothetical protein